MRRISVLQCLLYFHFQAAAYKLCYIKLTTHKYTYRKACVETVWDRSGKLQYVSKSSLARKRAVVYPGHCLSSSNERRLRRK